MSTFIIILCMGALISVGWFLRSWRLSCEIRDMLKNIGYGDDEQPVSLIQYIEVDIRKEGELFYIFEQKSGKFLAQGNNKEEIGEAIDKLNLANTSVVYIADEDQAKKVGLK